ncbi:MAG: NAD(P)H-dependent oxidoreductase [Candidatus Omnitrophica bacterium]|nr:NAD(P)H-dependent oxidoreductase [Candidatus Omnitrophota bacterium]
MHKAWVGEEVNHGRADKTDKRIFMKIVVLNGSPLGVDLSITMKSIEFIQKIFPYHKFEIIEISKNIKKIEKDEKILQDILNKVEQSDGVIWAFPVYILLIPAQYKRFIELIFEKNKECFFNGKYTAAFSTSIHFHDNIAHNYIRAICDDLNMKYIGCFSGERLGLLKEKERKELVSFAEYFFESVKQKMLVAKRYRPIISSENLYRPKNIKNVIDVGGKKIVILIDGVKSESNLIKMVNGFVESIDNNAEIIDIEKLGIKNGCIGCYHCGYESKCVHDDEFTKLYNAKIKPADIIIFAGKIKDRYISSSWKLFLDRSFFNNHVPVFIGKQVGMIISGPLEQISNLREMLEAYVEWQQGSLVDIVTDECENSDEIDDRLKNLAIQIVTRSDRRYIKSRMFYGIAGTRLLRDYVWGDFRFALQIDHKTYKKLGLYDFSHNNIKMRVTNFILYPLMKIPIFRREFVKRFNREIIRPHKKLIKNYIQNDQI